MLIKCFQNATNSKIETGWFFILSLYQIGWTGDTWMLSKDEQILTAYGILFSHLKTVSKWVGWILVWKSFKNMKTQHLKQFSDKVKYSCTPLTLFLCFFGLSTKLVLIGGPNKSINGWFAAAAILLTCSKKTEIISIALEFILIPHTME